MVPCQTNSTSTLTLFLTCLLPVQLLYYDTWCTSYATITHVLSFLAAIERAAAKLPRPLCGPHRRPRPHRHVPVRKGDTREPIRIRILPQGRCFVHRLAIRVDTTLRDIHNTSATQLFATAIGPAGDTLIDGNVIVDEELAEIDAG